jgi:hypothetical protein
MFNQNINSNKFDLNWSTTFSYTFDDQTNVTNLGLANNRGKPSKFESNIVKPQLYENKDVCFIVWNKLERLSPPILCSLVSYP